MEPLRKFARSIQDSTAIYSFDVQRVAVGDAIGSILSSGFDGSCMTTRGTTSASCRLVQGLVAVIGTCVIISAVTLFTYVGWCIGRCCSKCCCNSKLNSNSSFVTMLVFGSIFFVLFVFSVVFGTFVLKSGSSISKDVNFVFFSLTKKSKFLGGQYE